MFKLSLRFGGGMTKLVLLVTVMALGASCEKDPAQPSAWQALTPFPGDKTFFTAAADDNRYFLFFGIAQHDPNGFEDKYRNDIWMYDADRNEWSEKNPYDGAGRFNATAFTIDGDIYIIGGRGIRGPYPQEEMDLNEFLKYDPTSDTWTSLDPFPGQPRSGALAFVVDGVAYFGLGSSDGVPMRDLWQYNATTGGWRQLVDFPGTLPTQFLSPSFDGENVNSKLINFVFDSRIVLITGANWEEPESWTFDTSTEEWIQNEPPVFEDEETEKLYCVRSGAASIVYGGEGYVTLGVHVNRETQHSDVSRYNEAHNSWKETDTSPGASHSAAFSFVYKDGIIIGTEYNRYNRIRTSVDADPYELWFYKAGLVSKV